ERLFDDEVLAGLGCGDGVPDVILWVTANRDDLDARIGQHAGQFSVAADFASVARVQFLGVELARRTDRCDLGVRCGVDCCNVGASDPAVSDDPDVILFGTHASNVWLCIHQNIRPAACQSKTAHTRAKANSSRPDSMPPSNSWPG